MKVAQITYSLGSGGMEAFVTNLNTSGVFPESFDFILYTKNTGNAEFFEEKNINAGSKIYKLGDKCSSTGVVASIQKRIHFYKLLRKEKYNVVHIHGSNGFSLIEAIIAKIAGVERIVMHSHNTRISESSKGRRIKQIISEIAKPLWRIFADELCACSTEAGEWMFGEKICASGKVHIMKNGINASDYYYSENKREQVRQELGVKDNIVVGHVGRFEVQKNHLFLLDIFNEMFREDPMVRLLLIGDGRLRHEIEEKIHKLKLDDAVILYGRTNRVADLLQAVDLFLFPSLFEGLPVSGIEAQAASLPILAADTISPELDITGKVSWLSLTDSAKKWAEIGLHIIETDVNRTSSETMIQSNGYDIRFTARKLKVLYESSKG